MKRIGIGVAAAALLLLGASACSEGGFKPIAVTESPSYVASCDNLGILSVEPSKFSSVDNMTELTRVAREKGANTLLVTADKSTTSTGTAYLCKLPSTTGSTAHATSSK
jgi:hypothetical protein